jgi:hypothetical protein
MNYGLDDTGLELGSGKILSSSPKPPDRRSCPNKLCCNEYCSALPGNEAGGAWDLTTPPYIIDVKNRWRFTSFQPIYLRGVYKDNFTFSRHCEMTSKVSCFMAWPRFCNQAHWLMDNLQYFYPAIFQLTVSLSIWLLWMKYFVDFLNSSRYMIV